MILISGHSHLAIRLFAKIVGHMATMPRPDGDEDAPYGLNYSSNGNLYEWVYPVDNADRILTVELQQYNTFHKRLVITLDDEAEPMPTWLTDLLCK